MKNDVDTTVWLAVDTVAALAADAAVYGDSFLSPPERVRLSSIVGVRRQARFRAGRLLMRRLLARVHGGDALLDWPLTAAVDAAPAFLGEAFAQRVGAPWHMSISLSDHYVACAVASAGVGVDVEGPTRGRDLLVLGQTLCNDDEYLHLQALEGVAREQYFLALRTLKAAALKRRSGRSDPAALRLLATRRYAPPHVAQLVSPSSTATVDDEPRADAWIWQSPESTLAVVASGVDATPRWALPPPAFMLERPHRWTVQ
jgi:phosphopantetheinyl transferase